MLNNGDKPQNVLDFIQQLKNGQINPDAIDTVTKVDCAEYLLLEGYNRAQIAQILKMSGRTISRYYRRIRKKNKLTISPEFSAEFLGQLLSRANHGIDYLTRLSASKEAKTAEKIQARKDALQASIELTKVLLAGGFLVPPAQDEVSRSDDKLVVIKVVGRKPKERLDQ